MELLRRGAVEELAGIAAADPSALRFLTPRLWDEDREVARRSAEALAAVSHDRPDLGRELVRRFLWALNDESGTNAGPVLAALAEVAGRSPELLQPYVGALIPLLEDDGLCDGVLRVFEELVQAMPSAAAGLRDDARSVRQVLSAGRAERLRKALFAEEA